MDYRHYRGDFPEPPAWLSRHLHKLQYVGAVMLVSVPIIGWLTVLSIVQITFFLYLLGCFFTFFGIIFVIIGMVYDTHLDRSE